MNSIAMKLKYKRCLKTAQAPQFLENQYLWTPWMLNRNHVWFVWVCSAVWARRVDPGCWCLLLTVSSIFTNHHHPPATLLTSETTNKTRKVLYKTWSWLSLKCWKNQKRHSLCASSEVSMALISICARGRHQIWAGLQWSAFTLGLRHEQLQTLLREISIDEGEIEKFTVQN